MILRNKKRGVYVLQAPVGEGEVAYLDSRYKRVTPEGNLWWIPGMENTPQPMKGVGDLVKKVTDFLGVKQCPPCKERQERWNKALPFKKGQ